MSESKKIVVVTEKKLSKAESKEKDATIQSVVAASPPAPTKAKEKEAFWGQEKKPWVWRKLVKAIVTALAITAVSGFLITLSLYKLTAPEPAKATLKKVITVILTRMANPETGKKVDVNELVTLAAEATKQVPGLKLDLNTQDLRKLTPEAAIDSISIQAAEAIYEQQNVVTLPDSIAGQSLPIKFIPDSSRSLQFFNRSTHESLRQKLQLGAAAAGVLLVLLALISRGGSRLSAPGWAILLPSLPIFLIIYFSENIITELFNRFDVDAAFAASASKVVSDILPTLVTTLQPIYLGAVIAGISLILMGLVVHFVFKPKTAISN
jgi:hypothetical protein